MQSLHMSDPSPNNNSFPSESSKAPHGLHLKQSMCQRFPASIQSAVHVQSRHSNIGRTKFESLSLLQDLLDCELSAFDLTSDSYDHRECSGEEQRTSPQPLHGYAALSSSIGDEDSSAYMT